jgi:hypothetical protein
MSTDKEKVYALLNRLPDDCSFEDIQYHLYVLAKARNGLDVTETQGTFYQEEVERRLGRWLIE